MEICLKAEARRGTRLVEVVDHCYDFYFPMRLKSPHVNYRYRATLNIQKSTTQEENH
jgi:hypothetical protein